MERRIVVNWNADLQLMERTEFRFGTSYRIELERSEFRIGTIRSNTKFVLHPANSVTMGILTLTAVINRWLSC